MEALNSESLHLIIFPTEQCNLRCWYCYEQYQIGTMPDNIIAGVKRLLTKRYQGLKQLNISWFGGEPLLAVGCIRAISQHIHWLNSQFPSVQYHANITTNATLLSQDLYNELCIYGINLFHITLDGPRWIHDRLRRYRGGQGSFDRIWGNLLSIRNESKGGAGKILLRIHYSMDTWHHLEFLIKDICREFEADKRFKLYFRPIQRLSDKCNPALLSFPKKRQAEIESSLRGFMAASEMEEVLPANENSICYAAAANSLGVRSNGTLCKCTVALDKPINNIGRIDSDGTLVINQMRWRLWLHGLSTGDQKSLVCPLRAMLNGFADNWAKVENEELSKLLNSQ
ncbi:MAG: hypothetical protein A4E64_02893 [Syntrophorhabdus sp. PtaU1.Bin058]|nr:MAG: hypothetical protein A4E64_02893 [Syntrophorhabdus sp. PtaU1.Bin058]